MLCPVCKQTILTNPRYPLYLCTECQEYAPIVTENHRRVRYSNQPDGFGVQGLLETGELIYDPICFIYHKKYVAIEYRYGGIMIVPYQEEESGKQLDLIEE